MNVCEFLFHIVFLFFFLVWLFWGYFAPFHFCLYLLRLHYCAYIFGFCIVCAEKMGQPYRLHHNSCMYAFTHIKYAHAQPLPLLMCTSMPIQMNMFELTIRLITTTNLEHSKDVHFYYFGPKSVFYRHTHICCSHQIRVFNPAGYDEHST